MGALAPLSSWIPQDDLLLKNAVEAGASLESLAKGAVKFSRRFTVQELQDRWLSLLCDPLVSAEACARMIEFEHSASSLPLKPNKFGISKENTCALGKRKVESVRKCYYAVRKRICNEPFGSMDLSFLVEPGNNNCIANQDEPPSANFMVGDPISNHFGAHDSNFGTMHHAFPQFAMGSSVAGGDIVVNSHALYTGYQNQVEDLPMDHTFTQNLPLKEQPFDADDIEAKPLSVYDGSTSPVNLCSGFGGTHALNSPISDCGASFHNLVYSSPLPQMPIWSTIGPTLPDIHPSEDEQCTGDAFSVPDNHNANNTDTYELKTQMRCDNIENSIPAPDDYLAAISDTLFNFTNEEELLYVDGDGADGLSKSYIDGFGSLLLDSPNVEASVASDEYMHTVCSSEAQILQSVFSENPQFHELHDEVICCMLNTEDSEIPCNDDVFLPNRMLSSSLTSVPPKFHEVNDSTSPFHNDFSDNQKTNSRGPILIKRERKIFENVCSSSDMIEPQLLPERGLNHPEVDCGVKFEFPNGDYPQEALRSGSTACGGPNHISSATIDTEMEQIKHLSCTSAKTHLEKPLVPQINSSLAILNHQASHVESSFVEMTALEPVINPSEQEELLSESDDDVPYFSDVEAVILDMDLSPDDQDLYSLREGNSYVSKYQHEDSKRAIIRLEQAAHSYMQRVIASQGAFAVLYGRRAKYFIKKPEVLVGRATEDVQVDIDLGSEGHASKISRRQAIIKMDKGGSFYLTNLGRCPIFVNNKEITPRRSLSLTSGCLVEIRGLPFLFETNQTCIKQYVDNIFKESKKQEDNEKL